MRAYTRRQLTVQVRMKMSGCRFNDRRRLQFSVFPSCALFPPTLPGLIYAGRWLLGYWPMVGWELEGEYGNIKKYGARRYGPKSCKSARVPGSIAVVS